MSLKKFNLLQHERCRAIRLTWLPGNDILHLKMLRHQYSGEYWSQLYQVEPEKKHQFVLVGTGGSPRLASASMQQLQGVSHLLI